MRKDGIYALRLPQRREVLLPLLQPRLEVAPKQDEYRSRFQFRIAFRKHSLLLGEHKIVGRLNHELPVVRPGIFLAIRHPNGPR